MMKTKKMLTLMLAVMLLVASLAVTVHADVETYSFNGNCKKYFTTRNALEQSNGSWTAYVRVNCSELTYDDPTFLYACAKLVLGDGSVCEETRVLFEGSCCDLTVPSDYDGTKLKVRLIHAYYSSHNVAASYNMHIEGLVEKH